MISKVAFPWSLCQGEIGLSIENGGSSKKKTKKENITTLGILKRTWNKDVKRIVMEKGAVSPLTAFVECETEIIRYTVKRAQD